MCIRDRCGVVLCDRCPDLVAVTGLIATENVVGTLGVLYHFGGELSENGDEIWAAVAQDYTALSAYAFMIFNMLCAPCFAAMRCV